MTLQKQIDFLKEQNESNKQFFANTIKEQQDIRGKNLKKIQNSFLN